MFSGVWQRRPSMHTRRTRSCSLLCGIERSLRMLRTVSKSAFASRLCRTLANHCPICVCRSRLEDVIVQTASKGERKPLLRCTPLMLKCLLIFRSARRDVPKSKGPGAGPHPGRQGTNKTAQSTSRRREVGKIQQAECFRLIKRRVERKSTDPQDLAPERHPGMRIQAKE